MAPAAAPETAMTQAPLAFVDFDHAPPASAAASSVTPTATLAGTTTGTPPAPAPAHAHTNADQPGFELGWDHARHGLVPPLALLSAGTPVCQGWLAARAVFGGRTLAAPRPVRSWLQWRTRAWRDGQAFDTRQLTPQSLQQLEVRLCPVLRQPLCGAPEDLLAATLDRLNPATGWAPGNLVMLSRLAAEARAGTDAAQAQRHAVRLEHDGGTHAGLDAAAWRRLSALAAMATPLPLPLLAGLPLAVLPPPQVRPCNAVQRLQVLATQLFARPGWAQRTRALGALLPLHALRTDWNLFVGALMPRALEARAAAGADRPALHHALADAWLQPRLQRRWQHLVLQLGEAGCQGLLQRAEAGGLAPA
jgi:hypothetical protein